MANKYDVNILTVQEVHDLPGSWPLAALRQILTVAEFEDAEATPDVELLDMALMVLQDLGNQLAGELVLEVVFGEEMRPGVRQNLVDDLQQDEPWGDFAEVSQQRGLFIAVVLLHQAFPNRYATPDALKVGFSVRAQSTSGLADLATASPAWMMCLLAAGMGETDVLPRLYEDELQGGEFNDAAGMIWHLERTQSGSEQDDRCQAFELTSSRLWLSPLSRGQSFSA